jgi:hypothetical protein
MRWPHVSLRTPPPSRRHPRHNDGHDLQTEPPPSLLIKTTASSKLRWVDRNCLLDTDRSASVPAGLSRQVSRQLGECRSHGTARLLMLCHGCLAHFLAGQWLAHGHAHDTAVHSQRVEAWGGGGAAATVGPVGPRGPIRRPGDGSLRGQKVVQALLVVGGQAGSQENGRASCWRTDTSKSACSSCQRGTLALTGRHVTVRPADAPLHLPAT